MDDAGPLVVVGFHSFKNPPYYSIRELETSVPPHESETQQQMKVDAKGSVIHFNKDPTPPGEPRIRWLFSPMKNSTQDLYMVPNWGFSGIFNQTVKPLEAYKFNLVDGTCKPIDPPLSSKLDGYVASLEGRIYLMGYDSFFDVSIFQCYDPAKKSWKRLENFPHDITQIRNIDATVVYGNYILFNMECYEIWAYDVIKCKWCQVVVEDEECYSFGRDAVVVGDTIYAFSKESFCVVAISIEIKPNDGGLLLKCSSENLLPNLYPINSEDEEVDHITWFRSRHFVHLSKDNFCIVQSCNLSNCDYQYIKLTYVKLNGKSSEIVYECVNEMPTGQDDDQFVVLLCFALPKGATTVLKEGNIFNLVPYPEAFEEEAGDEIGCSVYVRELPSEVTLEKLELGLRRYGQIDRIQASEIEEGKRSVFVEFRITTFKKLAIEASPIIIGNCPVILEQRLKEHTI